jgi:hypothetical protein
MHPNRSRLYVVRNFKAIYSDIFWSSKNLFCEVLICLYFLNIPFKHFSITLFLSWLIDNAVLDDLD